MKKLSIALNLALTIAVIILFYLHFSNPNTDDANEGNEDAVLAKDSTVNEPVDAKIVYLNVDSVWKNYDFVTDMEDDLVAEKTKYTGQAKFEMRKLEKEVADFREKAQFMTQQQGEEKQMELMLKEQSLLKLEESLNQKYIKSEQAKTKQVHDAIRDYLVEYNSSHNYEYILGQTFGTIPYADASFDITQAIINGLNAKYKEKKEAAEKKENE